MHVHWSPPHLARMRVHRISRALLRRSDAASPRGGLLRPPCGGRSVVRDAGRTTETLVRPVVLPSEVFSALAVA
eukprot:1732906-Pleurochrysis_carterae.AAC.1